MNFRHISFLLILFLSAGELIAQDRLLLTNGRIKKLKGKVVYYDYEDIFYQSERAYKAMKRDSIARAMQQKASKASEDWKLREEKKQARSKAKKAKQKAKVDKLKAKFEEHAKAREQTLSAYDFEQWKQAELDAIKALENKHELYWALQETLKQERLERMEGKFRSKYTRSRSRQTVFSILREDGTEEVVYNADTLGLLADGTFEVEYGVTDMRLYIKGRQDGRKHSFSDVYIGASTGLVSGLLFTYFLDLFYAPIPPTIGIVALAARNNFKPSPKLEVDPALLQSEAYMDGYIQSAKGRKIFAFTVGAVGGMGLGIGVAVATSPLLR